MRAVDRDFPLVNSAGDLIDRANPDGRSIGRCGDEQGENTANRDGEGRAHFRQGWCAGAIVGHHLPVGVGAALKSDANDIDDRREGQVCG